MRHIETRQAALLKLMGFSAHSLIASANSRLEDVGTRVTHPGRGSEMQASPPVAIDGLSLEQQIAL